jgi:fructosamine-3-kinase
MTAVNWLDVRRQLVDKTGETIGEFKATRVSGGDINQAYRLSDGRISYFVKVNRTSLLWMFEAEAAGLEVLRESNTIRVPKPILTGISASHAFIVMEYITFGAGPDEARFAQQLASLHACEKPVFGFAFDNTIGTSLQLNAVCDNWVSFWQQQRLGYQLALAQNNNLSSGLIDSGFRLNEKLNEFFTTYQPRPSLLHGDLWAGNAGADAHGEAVIFDPACYYGDHETDLAMMELFAAPSRRFFDAYNEHFVIDTDYALRRDLYNLYHVLNHANLFGGSYSARAQNLINQLLAQTYA